MEKNVKNVFLHVVSCLLHCSFYTQAQMALKPANTHTKILAPLCFGRSRIKLINLSDITLALTLPPSIFLAWHGIVLQSVLHVKPILKLAEHQEDAKAWFQTPWDALLACVDISALSCKTFLEEQTQLYPKQQLEITRLCRKKCLHMH